MRLIDADALECDSEWSEYADDYVSYSKTEIDNAPTIDAVPVVRCKDCKWFDKQRRVCHNPRYGDGYANYQPPNTNDEYWCADGERRSKMTDYIKREDAMKALADEYNECEFKRYAEGLFKDIPPADVAPIRHGKWIEKEPIEYFHGHELLAVRYSNECSECGTVEPREYRYCPNCGARMDGESYE